jgi:hypothetical protein
MYINHCNLWGSLPVDPHLRCVLYVGMVYTILHQKQNHMSVKYLVRYWIGLDNGSPYCANAKKGASYAQNSSNIHLLQYPHYEKCFSNCFMSLYK